MFRRRVPLTRMARLRGWIWPRSGLRRAVLCHVKRILRVPGSPHAIAAGVAAGIFAAFTPFVGMHVVIAALVAILAGGNVIVAAMTSLVGNPLTFPFFWFAGFELGKRFIGDAAGQSFEAFLSKPSLAELFPIIEPLTLGSVVLGLTVGALFYLPVRWAVARGQLARRERMAARRTPALVIEAAE
jgi:uncharacterized protein (DUF2062 family)